MAAWAQEQPPPLLLRSESRLVQISVVAEDKNGRPITGLTREDFTVTDNGKARDVKVFVNEPPAGSPGPALAPGTFTNLPASIDAARDHFSVILIDRVNTEFGDQVQARQHIVKFLRDSGPKAHVALHVLGPGLRIVHDFDTDPNEILKSFDAKLWTSTQACPSQDALRRMLKVERLALLERQVMETLDAFTSIANYLSGIPGRKSLIWLTAGFPEFVDSRVIPGTTAGERNYHDDIDRAIRRLNTAGIAVYPIDARGLSVQRSATINIQVMQEFAQRSGGRAFYNANNIDAGVRNAFDDIAATYSLGYYLTDQDMKPGVHNVQVRTGRKDVRLRYAEGYTIPEPSSKEVQVSEISRALLGPADSTTIPLTMLAGRREGTLALKVSLDARNVALDGDQGRLEMLVRFATGDGRQTGTLAKSSVKLDLKPANYETALRNGISVQQTFAIPPDAVAFRVLIHDVQSGRIGTVSIPLSKVAVR
jgi:VWFA-related protein